MSGHVKVSGSWKDVSSVNVKVSGAWKSVSEAYIKVSGVWKQWLAAWTNTWTVKSGTGLGTTYLKRGGVYADLANAKWFITYGLSSSGLRTSNYAYSTDGDTWTIGTLPASAEVRCIATDGSRVVACATANGTTAGTSQAYVSTNGTTWTTYSFPATTLTGSEIIWDGTRFLHITTDTSTNGLLYSTNGTSWSGIDVGNGGNAIDFDGTSRYIVVGSSSTVGRTCTSNPTVANNWSDITLPGTAQWTAIEYGDGTWLALQVNSNVSATSTNGTTWTARTVPFTTPTGVAHEVAYYQGKWYIYQDGTLYTSTDAITWTAYGTTWASSTLDYIYWWIKGPNRMLGIGNDSTTASTIDYLSGV